MTRRIALHFGALAQPIAKQLDVKPSRVAVEQKDADAVTRLLVRGLIAPKIAEQARRKILANVAAASAPTEEK